MALKMVKGNLERMFDKNLTDLVRGIRNNKDNEAKYIAQCIEEIKQELRQDNINVKSNAVAKLTYLQMCGYDISWAGFNIIEVMSSNRFTCKRIGYLAASQCFHPDSELLMLTTNMIRKDLSSTNQYDAGVALSGLSCFISTDLSRDLVNEIMTLMSSTKPYLRMKSVLMMYKVFLRYPEALRPAFPKLKEKLEDPDPSVQSAAVNVICELARKNPKNYLSLAPIFFKLMTTSTNNWMLIKIIKLFGALTPLEPRLGKKLIEPLTNLIHSTSAMSLLYECINTVIAVLISISSGMPNNSPSIQLCVQKLRILIEDSDQNLKYLGLLAMSKILKTHPKSVQTHKDLILACLDDKDESIRLRALDLLYGMVSKKNLMEIVRRLLGHMERAEGSSYRDELLYKVIEICSQGSYQYVTNFEWYLTVLVELILLESGSRHGALIAAQLLDVAIRVQAVRTFAVNEMASLLATYPASGAPHGTMPEVLYAAAWIVGEFASHLDEPERTLAVLLRPKPVVGHIQAVYVQNALKLFAFLLGSAERAADLAKVTGCCQLMLVGLRDFLSSADIEVQERASSVVALVRLLRDNISDDQGGDDTTTVATEQEKTAAANIIELTLDDPSPGVVGDGETQPDASSTTTTTTTEADTPRWQFVRQFVGELQGLLESELNPVAPKAQRKVQLPEGLDLDEWINTPPDSANASSADDNSSDDDGGGGGGGRGGGVGKFPLFLTESSGREANGGGGTRSSYKRIEYTQDELNKMREARLLEQTNNPNYLKPAKQPMKKPTDGGGGGGGPTIDGYDDIPIAEIALEVPLQIHSTKRSDKYLMEAESNRPSKKEGRAGGRSGSAKDGGGADGKRSSSGKKSSKRLGKKGKRYAVESDSESDDPKPLHVVNTVIELPEGAILSDSEDKNNDDPDDPHRALDIDLDAPFDDDAPSSREIKRKANAAGQQRVTAGGGGGLLQTARVEPRAKPHQREGETDRPQPDGPIERKQRSTSTKHQSKKVKSRAENETGPADGDGEKKARKERKKKHKSKKGAATDEEDALVVLDSKEEDAGDELLATEKPSRREKSKKGKGRDGGDAMLLMTEDDPVAATKEGSSGGQKKKHHSKSSKSKDRRGGGAAAAAAPKQGYEEMPTQGGGAKDAMI
ncbi:AP-3 complex subunit delta [Anopheles ziemanni]|uniref:AP-3 complex subunit delta n=1 Tax=Anopheles coustani TaxID=139045 RepID=UPI002657FDE4|nr:AP-3 complex subunit delta [Anopheles coustani]XP_058175651.1 AP-3 complex subunit delta [Anopheles ziemanni]